MANVLDVQDLTKCYPGTPPCVAVKGISFGLKEGEILGFLGPNGSGKTTTIQMLLGTLLTTSGSIHYFGRDFSKHQGEILQNISFASTYLSLPYILTVSENLEVVGFLYGLSRKTSKARYEPLLHRFGIHQYRNEKVAVLSAGQITRLMLVKAFFVGPKIVLLDEPTASLDPDISRDICDFLLEQRKKTGLSILFTSHKMEEVANVCDRVIFLDRGKIIADDLPKNLAKQSAFFRLRLVIIEDMQKAIHIARESNYPYKQDHRTIEIEMDEMQIPLYLHALSVSGVMYSTIHIEEPTLDDYFLKIARKSREL
jgi:ABC-2 type transport system ATP-binding protein